MMVPSAGPPCPAALPPGVLSDERRGVWAAARNVLAVRLDAAGDVLMTTPALRALRVGGARRITLLTSPAGAAIAALVPEIDAVIVYDAPWLKATAPRGGSAPELAMAAGLRARCFDAAVIFTVYSQNPLPSAFLCYLAEIPLRLAHCHENPYQLLTDWIPDPEPAQTIRHEVRRQLDLVAAAGCTTADERLSLRVPAADRLRTDALLAASGLDRSRPWAVIHPGASAPSRRYLPAGFAAAARELAVTDGWQIVLTGGPDEAALVEQVRSAMGVPAISLAGRLSLGELAAVIAAAPVLIANNSGPAHIAAAAGTPVVVLYALTNPQHTPWAVRARVLNHDVPCRNCYKSVCPMLHHNCLRLVPPGAVAAAARELAGKGVGGRVWGVGGGVPRAAAYPSYTRYPTPDTRHPRPEGRSTVTATIDVLVPTYNRPDALAATLACLIGQTWRDFAVVVSDQTDADNAAPDRTEPDGTNAVRESPGPVAGAVARVLRARGHHVAMHRHLPRRGMAEQRQFLLDCATAPYVLFIDDDVLLEPEMLARLLDAIRREGCGFVGCGLIGLRYDGVVRPEEQAVEFWDGPVTPEEVRPDTPGWERYRLHNGANLRHAAQRLGVTLANERLYKLAWAGGCVLYDAAKLRATGGFEFWRGLPAEHAGEDVLAQQRVMSRYGGCGLLPSGAYHQDLPTTLPNRELDLPKVMR